ncbi:MAG: hypothetical protein OEL56_01460 [Nitrosopumilus sp.]|nr:hypothetical protein [Nitrosopumilus sp.]MDH3515220.1 hypothetical protein [Nitrosopumilus sp.]MDH3564479.1 hypothetical protein [Nitrosopumilus sp.]MDH5418013.1 hypothetical protein [Nitrosopumilus sp.]MDH5554313.1 hypothetical protein [Nitrosopumilus sp.]
MSTNLNTITKILNEIKKELTMLISLEGNSEQVNSKNLFNQTNNLNEAIHASEISEKNKSMLEKFALTLQEGITVKSLRYEKQDLERILSNLND